MTAYDVAIGGGLASSDPKFYAYLCAVADWRLQMDVTSKRPGILKWVQFIAKFDVYWNAEPVSRQNLIKGNARYYSTGELPACVPALHTGLPSPVVCESMQGIRSTRAPIPEPKQAIKAVGEGRKGQI